MSGMHYDHGKKVSDTSHSPGPDAITPRLVAKVLAEVGKLEPMSQLIIERHFGIGETAETLAEIAHQIGKDVGRVRMLENNALSQIAKRASRA